MAVFEMGTMAVGSAVLGSAAWLVRRSTNQLLHHFAVYLSILCLIEVAVFIVVAAVSVVAGDSYSAWWLLLLGPIEGYMWLVHLPSILALGVDEILERHGAVLSSIAHLADLVLWALVAAHLRSRRAG